MPGWRTVQHYPVLPDAEATETRARQEAAELLGRGETRVYLCRSTHRNSGGSEGARWWPLTEDTLALIPSAERWILETLTPRPA